MLDLREKLGDSAVYGASLTHAREVQALHEEYPRADSTVVETNTFAANRMSHIAGDVTGAIN